MWESFNREYIAASEQMDMGPAINNKVEILLVEDNADDVALTLHVFKKANLSNKVHVLVDGMDAIDYILCRGKHSQRTSNPASELVLLDLNLPKLHGLDVLRQIKSDERTRSLAVVILTASQEERGVMQSYKLGAQGCIVKPFDFLKFTEALSELPISLLLLGKSQGA